MNFFGKVEPHSHRKYTDRNGIEQTIYPFVLRDPNSEQAISLEIYGADNARRFAEQGFATGAIGTMHIFPTVRQGNDERFFNSLRCVRWELASNQKPVTTEATAGLPTKEQVIEQQAKKQSSFVTAQAPEEAQDNLPF